MIKKIGLWLTIAILLTLLATPVLADGPDGDVVIWGENYVLKSGQRIKGELFVYGGNVVLKPDSQVDGNVNVFGGNLNIGGEVKGDVSVWGGNVTLESGCTVRGQVVAVGGNVNRQEGADVRGDEIEGLPFQPPAVPRPPIPPRLPRVTRSDPWKSDLIRSVGNVFRSAFSMLILIVLGILVVAFLPRHTETVAETMVKAPLQSMLSGVATFIVGLVLLTILSIVASLMIATICLAPVGLILLMPVLVAGVALLLGWIASGLLLGVKLLRALTHEDPNHIVAVAIGLPILSLLTLIPCLGWLLALIVVMWGLGAVVYSLFGTRTYDQPTPHVASDEPEYDPRMDRL